MGSHLTKLQLELCAITSQGSKLSTHSGIEYNGYVNDLPSVKLMANYSKTNVITVSRTVAVEVTRPS